MNLVLIPYFVNPMGKINTEIWIQSLTFKKYFRFDSSKMSQALPRNSKSMGLSIENPLGKRKVRKCKILVFMPNSKYQVQINIQYECKHPAKFQRSALNIVDVVNHTK